MYWPSVGVIVSVVVVAVFAVLYQQEVPGDAILVNKTVATDTKNVDNIFTYISDPKNLEEWFPGIVSVTPRDSKALKVGKRYDSKFRIPVIGEISLPLTVYQFKPPSNVTISVSSSLRPFVTFKVFESNRRSGEKIVRVNVVVSSKRRGFLFHCFATPVLGFIGGQHMSMSLFRLRSLLS